MWGWFGWLFVGFGFGCLLCGLWVVIMGGFDEVMVAVL